MATPFFSIITVSFRAENTIEQTIKSALAQDFSDFEVIVKDGLSDDKTLENIPKDDKVKVFSQKDSGIYDAMNQGTELASGQYVIYMNCGDNFASNTVLSEFYAAIKESKPSMAYGNYIRDGILHKQPSMLTHFYMYRTPLCHQTIFFNRQDLVEMGIYDNKYRILGDYDAELKLLFKGKKIEYVNAVVCEYLGGGVSESKSGSEKKAIERQEIIKKHFPRKMRMKFKIKLAMSMPRLRNKIAGGTSPAWMRRMYQKAVNKINK